MVNESNTLAFTPLYLRGEPIDTVFDLLGKKENDLTYSLGWAICQCPELLNWVAKHAKIALTKTVKIDLQESSQYGGFTDLEVSGGGHLIIEAKRGFALPSKAQLRLYASRLRQTSWRNPENSAFLVISDCSEQYVRTHLPAKISQFRVRYLSWEQLCRVCSSKWSKCNNSQKRLLAEISRYFSSVAHMQDKQTNMVYVVVASNEKPDWSNLRWRDFPVQQRVYFHPINKHWPQRPPKYIAFRWDGQLQQIHHIDSFDATDDLSTLVPEVKGKLWRKERFGEDYFVYRLGPPIYPQRTVKNGKIYGNGRIWAELDLLLTSNSIAAAVKKSKARQVG